jgi:predicted nucleic acid-binding protein
VTVVSNASPLINLVRVGKLGLLRDLYEEIRIPETVRQALEDENIEARPVWKPMHLQPVFRVEAPSSKLRAPSTTQRYRARVVGGEVAEDLFNRGLCLPSGTAMTEGDLNRVISVIRRFKR